MTALTFGSLCSGIDAASVAWNPLGWHAAWMAEIEPFPCAVLAHHYPTVPNLGDMTKIARMIRDGYAAAPDILCGGTPCQAFSVAGLRKSLDDARGNLSLIFCEIADEIDAQRAAAGLLPAIIFWENVPGVLNTKDNAFGCFLAGLAGEDDPLVAPGGKWPNAGVVFGPQRVVAWRVLDAQFFGVAQRRRRVFVVASARDGFDPAAVLFEPESMHRNSAPSREAGQNVAGTISARTSGGGGLGTDFELGGGFSQLAGTLRQTDGGVDVDHAIAGHLQPADLIAGGQLARCLTTKTRIDAETETLIPTFGGVFSCAAEVCPTLRAGGNSTGGDRPPGTDVDTADSLIACVRSVALRGRDGGATAELGDDLAGTLRASGGGGGGDKAHVLAPLAFDCKASGMSGFGVGEIASTMRAMGHANSHQNGGGHLAVCITGDITHTLKAEGFDASEDGTGRGQPIVAAFAENSRGELRLEGGDGSRTGTLSTGGGKSGQGMPMVMHPIGLTGEINADTDFIGPLDAGSRSGGGQPSMVLNGGMAVRRLTPRECERLQGFPDDYTLVLHRNKPAADGPRYKALGNSWAVPNVAWIGRRIAAELAKQKESA